MADIPIIMSSEMVRALLREIEAPGTGKTQTRRLAWTPHKPTDDNRILSAEIIPRGYRWLRGMLVRPSNWQKVRPGDRLWVRETWRTHAVFDDLKPTDITARSIYHCADGPAQSGKLRPSIFMPRWASRITLDVTEARMQRVQEISPDDGESEGLWYCEEGEAAGFWFAGPEMTGPAWGDGTVECYARLWDSLHKPGNRWDDNPDICAISFLPKLSNIDDAPDRAESDTGVSGRQG